MIHKSIRKHLMLTIFAVLAVLCLASCKDTGPVVPPIIEDSEDSDTETEAPEIFDTEYVPEMDDDADRIDGIAIKSAEELAKIGVDKDYPLDGDYVLVIDIDLSDYESWTPIGNNTKSGAYSGDGVFTGTFDGRNHFISNMRIDESTGSASFWGLFGTVGNRKSDDPAIVKNVVLTGVDVNLSATGDTAVGALAGQVNGYAEISSISLLSGSVTFSGSGSLGVGGLIGQCRTTVQGKVSNKGVSVEDIFSNVTVDAENAGWNNCAGIIGRIRDSQLGKLQNIVLIAKAKFENSNTYAIAAGDSTAAVARNLYYLSGTGKSRDGLGEAKSSLTNGKIDLSGLWTVSTGFVPMLSDVLYSPAFSLMDMATIKFAEGENKNRVKSNFVLPTTISGVKIKWASSNSDVIEISGAGAKVKQPEDGYVDVILSAEGASYTKSYNIRVVATKLGYFLTDYIEAGKPIEVGGYADGTQFKWVITKQATGKSHTERTDVPYFTPSEADIESVITVQADGYDDISLYYSILPVMYITSEKKYSSVPSGKYVDVEMKLCAPEEYKDFLYNGDAKIKVRGNSTAGLEKKPFKVKLDTKADLLGLDDGGNKHWCLMANAKDPTLMRNKILNDFSGAIGTEVYMHSDNVVLMYNGKYFGVYQLCEHVRVDDSRVDVFDWEEYAETAGEVISAKLAETGEIGFAEEAKIRDGITESMMIDWSWMKTGQTEYNDVTYVFTEWGLDPVPPQTGGFLLEMDFYSQNNGALMRTETAYKQPLYFNTPAPDGYGFDSFEESDLYNYTYKYIQSFEYAIHSDDFFFRNSDTHFYAEVFGRWNWNYKTVNYKDDVNDGLHYSEMFDMENLVQNFIFCEIIMNWDSMKNSFFVYKDIDELAKIGPQWDFDWAWGNVLWNGNTWRPTSWHCREDDFMIEQYYQEEQWNCLLIRDPYFLVKVWEMWQEMRDEQIEDLVGDNGIMAQYQEFLRPAALANDAKWSQSVVWGNTFDSEMERMWDFVHQRMNWLDKQFVSVEKLISSLGVYRASDSIEITDVTVLSGGTTVTARVYDDSISYVMFQINGTNMVEAAVKNGKATVTVDSEMIENEGYNCITAFAEDNDHDYIIDTKHSDAGNYNLVVSNYYYFEVR